jgi:polysaccharide biosynthesis/export protein
MKSSFLLYLLFFTAVSGNTRLEAAWAQEQGPNRGVQSEPVPLGENHSLGKNDPAASKPDGADGTGNPLLGGKRRPLYRLSKSDVLEVSFAFAPELNQTVTVQPDGYISLRGADAVVAEGRALAELEEEIRRTYATTLHEPQVTVVLKEFDKPYFIASGEVGRPGKYELRSDTTLTEAVAIAGGFTEKSRHSQVLLFRHMSADMVETRLVNVKEMLKRHTLAEDLRLQPGDFVFVPRSTVSNVMRFMPSTSMGMYLNALQF